MKELGRGQPVLRVLRGKDRPQIQCDESTMREAGVARD